MASVIATVANNTGTTTYRVYSWVSGIKGALIATGTSLPLTFTPLVGSHQYVLETTDSTGCVITSAPQVVNCTLGMTNIDLLFGLGSVSSVCCTNTLISNLFEFRIVDEDGTSVEFNQQSNIGTGTDRVIPNGATVTNGYIIAPLAKSCVGPTYAPCTGSSAPAQAFFRFGVSVKNLLTAYPSKTSFSYKLYGRKVVGKNVITDNYFRIVYNYAASDCTFVATTDVDGTGFTRTGTCTLLGVRLLPGPSTAERYEMINGFTTFTDLGTITINTITNETTFTKSSNLV